ncbi:MAG: hypothetical protein IH886_13980 [Nitrospinae bacterium]|nr:hypothetical protein [Nitrospinota bacterium]
MKTIAPLDFSNVIAFLIPGFVSFYALKYFSPPISGIIEKSLSDNSNVGAMLVLLLSSLGIGIIVSAFRSLTLDKICLKFPDLDYSKLADEKRLAAFNEVITNIFRYSQFYGNMFISIFVLMLGNIYAVLNLNQNVIFYIALITTMGILWKSHHRDLKATYDRLKEIIPK